MGRGKKQVVEDNIDKRESGYYSTPRFVADYVSKRMLEINPSGKKVLDPCCGKEELLNIFLKENMLIDGFDINTYSHNYKCNFKEKDFLRFYGDRKNKKLNNMQLKYDYFIANPPYNCHEVELIKGNKTDLKKIFSDVGIYNTYSMFISAIIDLAKPNAIIGLITHDSFFTAKYHESLRRKIVKECAIHEITMCPTDLFKEQGADVRTSIIILQKGIKNQKYIRVNNRVTSTKEFRELIEGGSGSENITSLKNILLDTPYDNLEFIIDCNEEIKKIFKMERISNEFKCVTGISTGNDKKYLSTEKIEPYIIPYYKNPGNNRFYTNNYIYIHKSFLEIQKDIKNFMVRNKELLFLPGITCSSVGVNFTAAKLPKGSAFGVNPNIICKEEDSWWLMAYLNSSLVTYLVRGILLRSNMITSGYVSRIPLIKFTKLEKEELSKLSKEAYTQAKEGEDISNSLININSIVYKACKLSEETIRKVSEFEKKIVKKV
ncbi:HsdM family class I SAM-dependent methyltransferase [Clostridium gasigenes]|uniref:site-specific DNA-methyltransferase (adenine-specific) n=1 Tax=Clostridium gasigenes TaxID=94869 RepID=A0A1H0M4F7_9CLOT|nr:N-6 DNA methylase [Clostridium gasigenes]MBB6622265.1 N-6 DNA methylase [Clostridium gasigenes]MBU3087045.1 N-6 DNA methylase [Clostridium gasigenes]SDO75255.1 N-6 DNA Methylase [Clostridium gasigenes]